MTEATPASARRTRWLLPLPIVVDSDVLWRNIEYAVRKGWDPSLLGAASPEYSQSTGVLLFATSRVQEETERHLPKIAKRLGVPVSQVAKTWDETFLPRIRFVELGRTAVDDPRIDRVRELHEDDAPTAALAVAIAPCVVLTDNRRHFQPFGLSQRGTDEVALDAFAMSRLVMGTNAALTVPALAGVAIAEGSKKLTSSALGRDGTAAVALVLMGAVVFLWRTKPGTRLRESARDFAREVGPRLTQAVAEGAAASERAAALAIDPEAGQMSAVSRVARALVCERMTMSTAEIARLLHESGHRCLEPGNFRTHVRRWLLGQDCFCEVRYGHWALGYYATGPAASSYQDWRS